jgi:5-methylcytosine-specific restriction endonuclease McrA
MIVIAKEYAKSFYASKAWLQCRQGYIKSVNGLCERCLKRKKYKKGLIVHHKIYITPENINDANITLNWDNLEYLCHECHNAEHFSKYEATRNDVTFDSNGNLIQV